MGQEFFIAFSKAEDFLELAEIIRRMNSANEKYEPGAGDAVSAMPSIKDGRRGFTIKDEGNHTCFEILWRKYFSLSHDKKQGVYFCGAMAEIPSAVATA